MLHIVSVTYGSVIDRAMASRSVWRVISLVGKLLLTRVTTPSLDLVQEFLFFVNTLKQDRAGLLLLLKLVSCRQMTIGLWSFIII